MTPEAITDAVLLEAADRASSHGLRMFSGNDIYAELGLIRGKGPRWGNRRKLASGNRITQLLLSSGYAVRRDCPSLTSTCRYYKISTSGLAQEAAVTGAGYVIDADAVQTAEEIALGRVV